MKTLGNMAFGMVRIGQITLGIAIDQMSEVCHVNAPVPLPIPSASLLGGFELRGSLVPLLDVSRICSQGPETEQPHLAVVLRHAEAVIAFYVDEVMGIATCSEKDVQTFLHGDALGQPTIKGLFRNDDQFVSILDVPKVFDLPDVYAAQRPGLSDKGETAERLTRQLTFKAGGAIFSVPAIEVYAAVPRQEIKVTAITAGPCLGEISYYGRRVPVACPVSLLGIGEIRERGPSEVVVMRFPDDTLLGLAVEAIRNIESFTEDREAKIPLTADGSKGLISHLSVQSDGTQIYAVDIAAFHQDAETTTLASLSEQAVEEQKETVANTVDDTNANVVRERERYLVVQAGTRVAIPLAQVTCILNPPAETTPAAEPYAGFRGYFSRLGQSVALFGLADCLHGGAGGGAAQDAQVRIVLTGEEDAQVGFEVDQVISIEESQWREVPKDDNNPVAVQLGTRSNRTVLPLVSLDALVPA